MDYEELWSTVRETVTEFATTWGIKVVGVLVAIFIGWIVAGWVKRLILSRLKGRSFDPALTGFSR